MAFPWQCTGIGGPSGTLDEERNPSTFIFTCRVPGSTWALELAKHNLVHNYFLVGVTEELEDFVAMLEYSLPRMFRGALDLYVSGWLLVVAAYGASSQGTGMGERKEGTDFPGPSKLGEHTVTDIP